MPTWTRAACTGTSTCRRPSSRVLTVPECLPPTRRGRERQRQRYFSRWHLWSSRDAEVDECMRVAALVFQRSLVDEEFESQLLGNDKRWTCFDAAPPPRPPIPSPHVLPPAPRQPASILHYTTLAASRTLTTEPVAIGFA